MDALIAEVERCLEGGAAGAPLRSDPPAGVGADLHRYSTDQMRDVLERALLLQQTQPGKFSRQEIVDAAREVGVEEGAIDAALRQIDPATPARGPNELTAVGVAELRRRTLRSFWRHLASYAVVNVFLYFMSGHWNRWVLTGWGIGVALHLVNVIFPKEPKERDAKAKKGKKQKPEPEPPRLAAPPEVDAGVAALLAATTARAKRIRVASAPAAAEREAQREEAAEVEADAEAAAARARARGR